MDCLFPFVPQKALEVVFCYETIQPDRSGGTTDTVDILLKNVCTDESTIKDIYFLHPSHLFTTSPEKIAAFSGLLDTAEEKLKAEFNRFVLHQTPILLVPDDASNRHLRIDGFIRLDAASSDSSEQWARVTVFDPDPQEPQIHKGKIVAARLGTPTTLTCEEWQELNELGFSILQLRLLQPLAYNEACWLRVILKPRVATLVSPSPSVLDPLIPKAQFPGKGWLEALSRRLAFRVTYEASVVGPFDVRDAFKNELVRARTEHRLDQDRVATLTKIEDEFCTNGTHHSATQVMVNDCWLAASPEIEMSIGSIDPDGDIERVIRPNPMTLREPRAPKHLWKTGGAHIRKRNIKRLASEILEELNQYAKKEAEGRTKEEVSQAIGIPLSFCALIIDFLVGKTLIGERKSTQDDQDARPRYWLEHTTWDLEKFNWSPLFSHPESQPRFTIRLTMSWINIWGPLLSFALTVIALVISIVSAIFSYLSWRNSP